MTAKEYKKQSGLIVCAHFPTLICLAYNPDHEPMVWARLLKFERGEANRWIVTNDLGGRCYMFKEDGLFGFTDNREGRRENSFETFGEANDCFRKFYAE